MKKSESGILSAINLSLIELSKKAKAENGNISVEEMIQIKDIPILIEI